MTVPTKVMKHERLQLPRVVILGAGFAGLEVAQQLAQKALCVTLIDRQDHHTFQPLLHQVVTAELEAQQICYPIRSALRRARNVRFVQAEVHHIQTRQRQVKTSAGGFDYDFLVIATGATSHLEILPGSPSAAAPNSVFGLKTIGDAIALRHHLAKVLARAHRPISAAPDLFAPTQFESIQSASTQAAHTTVESMADQTVVIVGGGATGVELAGAIAGWCKRSRHNAAACLPHPAKKLVLLHSRDRLLPGFRPRLQRYALKQLQAMGVDVHCLKRVQLLSSQGVQLSDGQLIPTKTVIWTTGVRGNPPAWKGEGPTTHRLPVRPTLQLLEDDHIYAVGDVAAGTSEAEPWPMLASVAVQQGRFAARNIRRQAQGQRLKPFRMRHWGAMAILGRHAAVVQLGPLTLTGVVAWLIWLAVHLMLLRGMRQRLTTLLRWSESYRYRSPRVRSSVSPSMTASMSMTTSASSRPQPCSHPIFCAK